MGPACCTAVEELSAALAAADRVKDAAIRESVDERFAALPDNPTLDEVVEMNRAATADTPPIHTATPGRGRGRRHDVT